MRPAKSMADEASADARADLVDPRGRGRVDRGMERRGEYGKEDGVEAREDDGVGRSRQMLM